LSGARGDQAGLVRENHELGRRTRAFEQAWADLALVIGFASQQPEHETGRGPDGLWAVAGGTLYVIEAKSGAKANHPVYKSSARQPDFYLDHGILPGASR
jgi:hypothetical protein